MRDNSSSSVFFDKVQVGFYSALLHLMETLPYSDISVTQIARQAKRDRTTFYRYFESKEDLLCRCLFSFMDSVLNEIGLLDSWDRQKVFIKIQKLYGILERNQRALRILMGPDSPGIVKIIISKSIDEFCSKSLQFFFYQSLDKDMKFFLSQILGSCLMGAIEFWVDNQDIYNRDLMEKYLFHYGTDGIRGLFGVEMEAPWDQPEYPGAAHAV